MKLIRKYLVGMVALVVMIAYMILLLPLLVIDNDKTLDKIEVLEKFFQKLAGK